MGSRVQAELLLKTLNPLPPNLNPPSRRPTKLAESLLRRGRDDDLHKVMRFRMLGIRAVGV